MFNPLKNPVVVRTVFNKAQEELNQALIYRKKQFNNPNLYMWVEVDNLEQIPYISLRDEKQQNLIRMTAEELLQDEAIQAQLNKIPTFVKPFIKLKKIVPLMNQKLLDKLGPKQYIRVKEGKETAKLDLIEGSMIIQSNVSLNEIFS